MSDLDDDEVKATRELNGVDKQKELEEFEDVFGNVPFENIKKIQDCIEEKYIPKQKVKDKMEKLNKEIKNGDEVDAIFKIKQQQILQELLEDK